MDVQGASKGKRGACDACGDTPVQHLPAWVQSSFEAWLTDRGSIAGKTRASGRVMRTVRPLFDAFLARAADVLIAAHLIGVSADRSRACTYRSEVVWEEAHRRGIEMQQLNLFGIATEIYRAKMGDRWLYFQSIPLPDAEPDIFAVMDDKSRFKAHLSEHGFNVSLARCAVSLSDARAAFDDLRKPVVVKPRIGSRARHTTTNIWTLPEFDAAFKSAKTLCRYVLIEEHLDGPVCRATVVGGTLRGFLQMFPARVTGDGEHTIAELIERKNAMRSERVSAVTLDGEHLAYLSRSGLSPASILEAGREIDLSRRTGRFEGGATRELGTSIHPALRAQIEAAAKMLGAFIVGFDIIISDPHASPDSQRWGFLEANSLPYIDLHYFPLEGEPSNIASAVWDIWMPMHRHGVDAEKARATMAA